LNNILLLNSTVQIISKTEPDLKTYFPLRIEQRLETINSVTTLTQLKKDFSLSATIAGLVAVLVGMTSSAVIVFQAALAFGASASEAGSWLGSLCIGMGILAIYFSMKYKAPVLIAWSTAGGVLLVTGANGFSMSEAIGAFLVSAFLILLCGITGLFEKIMDRIPVPLTSGLLAGVLVHYCLDAFHGFTNSPYLIGGMFVAYLAGKKFWPQLTMMLVLVTGILVAALSGNLKFTDVAFELVQFKAVMPALSVQAILSLALPLFIVTMASQNLTGISVMRAYQYQNPISPLITGNGAMNLLTAFFGGFAINLAAITAAIGMGPECHPDRDKRYVSGVLSGLIYIMIGVFAGTVTSLFAAFPKEMITAIAGFALLGTVASGIEKALSSAVHREAAFLTFVVAASGLSFWGIGSAFWAVLVGLIVAKVKI
jgi:benzoate membrane transport protein